jgi:mono/diheme cytochrome c family protein
MRFGLAFLSALTIVLLGSEAVAAFDHLTWPDGRRVRIVQTNKQEDLSSLRSGITGKATDRRFLVNEAMFLANEIYLSGTEFFLRASEQKIPMAHDRQFSYLTNVEAYWYSRYNLLSMTARGRAGIGVIHGPYLDLRAQHATSNNVFGRQRGELAVSNKDVMLIDVIGSYLARSGMPKKFENAVPLMLEFKSADPRFVRPVDLEPEATGRARYLDDFETLRWNYGRMDKVVDMGAVAQTLLKKVLWAKFFLRRNHVDDDFPGQVFLGNNAEDGFRGSMLTLEAVSTMLLVKAALFFDPADQNLTGLDPTTYKASAGLRYLPHEIRPSLIYMSDMPVRHYDFDVQDVSSRLWDQASWLGALTEFFDFANPRHEDNWNNVFGYQTPYDGSVMEQKFALLAQALANTVMANIDNMHVVDGVLVSRWSPDQGSGRDVALRDLTLAVTALADFAEKMDLDEQGQARALKLVRQQADFLLKVAAEDGSYFEGYSVSQGTAYGDRDMTSQAFAIRALLAAHRITQDPVYLEGARQTNKVWNRDFWDSKAFLYRNQPGVERVVYTPVDVGAALAALREMILIDKDMQLLERFKRFFVQAIDASGMMQSEDLFTGEDIDAVRAGNLDSDGDGIPFLSGGDGKHGIDSVFAARVEFDLGLKHESPAYPGTSKTPSDLSGEKIYVANCAVCHGANGVGNEGPKLVDNPFVQLTGRSAVMSTISVGRVSVGMPAWDGILNPQEIERVVDYIRSFEESELPEIETEQTASIVAPR